MRYKFFVATLILFSVGVVGCKSTSQMAWWKSAKKSDVESTALAHSAAPELPSDVAKRAERLAANTTSGGEATPFVPNLAPPPVAITAATSPSPTTPAAGYPATEASINTVPAASTVASTSPAAYPTTEAAASHLGSIGMPYDPSAVPAPSPALAEQTPNTESQPNRYATTSLPSNIPSNTPANAATSIAQTPSTETYPSTNSRYGIPAVDLAENTTPANTTASNTTGPAPTGSGRQHAMSDQIAVKTHEHATPNVASVPVENPTAVGGNRYAASTPVPSAVEVPSFPVTSASAISTTAKGIDVSSKPPAAEVLATTIAETVPYRPGGTSSYPNSLAVQSPTQIATRPDAPVDSGMIAPTPTGIPSEAGTLAPHSTPGSRY